MKSKEFIIEATYELDEDVDLLYDRAFADIVDAIKLDSWKGNLPPEFLTTTASLKSPDAIKAHRENPMKIITTDGNLYQPDTQTISISLNMQLLKIIENYGGLKRAMDVIPRSQHTRLLADLTPERIKGSIHHELSHWLDDTFHNAHISKRVIRAVAADNAGNYKKATKIMNQNKKDVGLTDYELNAQIHSIKQLKRAHQDMWDLLSFDEMIDLNASLIHLRDKMKEAGEYSKWKKLILKRLYREHLLGEEMTNTY